MTLSLDTAYRSFGGEVEASSTPTICRLPDSRRHQLWAIARCLRHDGTPACLINHVVHGRRRRCGVEVFMRGDGLFSSPGCLSGRAPDAEPHQEFSPPFL